MAKSQQVKSITTHDICCPECGKKVGTTELPKGKPYKGHLAMGMYCEAPCHDIYLHNKKIREYQEKKDKENELAAQEAEMEQAIAENPELIKPHKDEK